MSQTYALVPAPQPFMASIKEEDGKKTIVNFPEKRETKEPKDIALLRMKIGHQESIVEDLTETEKREDSGRFSIVAQERNKLQRMKAAFEAKTKKREITKKSAELSRMANKEKRDKIKKMREKANADGFEMLSAVQALLEKKKDVPNSTFDNLSTYMKAMAAVHDYERDMGKVVEEAPKKQKGKKKAKD